MSWSTSELRVWLVHRLTGLSPQVKYLYWPFQGDTSFVDHLCYFCLVLLCFHERLFVDALWSPAGKELTSWLSFVMSNCDVITFPLVSLVRCGAWLYRFLIFVLFLTLLFVVLILYWQIPLRIINYGAVGDSRYNFGLKIHLHPYFVNAGNECTHLHMLAWTFMFWDCDRVFAYLIYSLPTSYNLFILTLNMQRNNRITFISIIMLSFRM